MNRMYHIERYILDKCLVDGNNKQMFSIPTILKLFLQYLDENRIVYGEGEFHRLAPNGAIVDEKI